MAERCETVDMTRLVAGIDGGQSSTTAALAADDGTIVGRGTGPPADLVGTPRGAGERRRAALETALGAAFAEAGLPAETQLGAIVVGLTGYDDATREPLPVGHADVRLFVHDTVIAHAGALGDDTGVVVLAGTGSVALGNALAAGPYVRAGGWGYYFGDAGSALWIAREAVARAMALEDRGDDCALARAARAFFELPDLRAIQHAFAHGELTRPALAAFAGSALALAEPRSGNDPDAAELRSRAAGELADLAVTVAARLANVAQRRVSYAGGVFGNERLRDEFVRSLRSRLPSAVVAAPLGDPLSGALRLARDLARDAPSFGSAAMRGATRSAEGR